VKIAKWVEAGEDADEDPALWRIYYTDEEEEDLYQSEVVDGLLAFELNMKVCIH